MTREEVDTIYELLNTRSYTLRAPGAQTSDAEIIERALLSYAISVHRGERGAPAAQRAREMAAGIRRERERVEGFSE